MEAICCCMCPRSILAAPPVLIYPPGSTMPARPVPTRPARGMLAAPLRYANLCGLAEVICGLLPGLTWDTLRGFANALALDSPPRACLVPAAMASIRPFAEDFVAF